MEPLREEIREEIRKITDPLGVSVVDLEAVRGKRGITIAVVVDKQGGVNITDCEKITNLFNARMEVLDLLAGQNYSFQVSSPGLYRVFKSKEEYNFFRSRKVKIFLREPLEGEHKSLELEGVLEGLDGEFVGLDVAGKKLSIPLSRISKTKLNG